MIRPIYKRFLGIFEILKFNYQANIGRNWYQHFLKVPEECPKRHFYRVKTFGFDFLDPCLDSHKSNPRSVYYTELLRWEQKVFGGRI